MGTKHDEQSFLDAAVELALEEGLAALTFGRLARRVGVADRTIVYYFPTKGDLLERVLGELGGRLIGALEEAFGSDRRPIADLLRTAYPLLVTDDTDPVFALWFELVGRAAAGDEPHRTLAHQMTAVWVAWLAERIDVGDLTGDAAVTASHESAAALMAQIDGALMLHHLGHADAARAAIESITNDS